MVVFRGDRFFFRPNHEVEGQGAVALADLNLACNPAEGAEIGVAEGGCPVSTSLRSCPDV